MKKKGFTLIELLAVIIVLAIIALIAMPIIFNVIENAKLKSMENSAYGVVDAVRLHYMENLMNSEDGTVLLSGSVTDLTLSGEHPTGGTWEIQNGKEVTNNRGIKIEGVTFASMEGYICDSEEVNNELTGKVVCSKNNITFTVADNVINANGWAKANFNVTVNAEGVTNLKYCIDTIKCTPNQNVSNNEVTITQEGTVYLCASGDNARTRCKTYNLDKTTPTLTAKNSNPTVVINESNEITTFLNEPIYGASNGSIVCKLNNNQIINTSGLLEGTHTVTCNAISNSGLSSSDVTLTITVSLKPGLSDAAKALAEQIAALNVGDNIGIQEDEKEGNVYTPTIQYYLLAKETDRALLMYYDDGGGGGTGLQEVFDETSNSWKDSSLRTYLNSTEESGFLGTKTVLNELIMETTIYTRSASNLNEFETTTDRVFIMSEADRLGTNQGVSITYASSPNDYTIEPGDDGNIIPDTVRMTGSGLYFELDTMWFRTPGSDGKVRYASTRNGGTHSEDNPTTQAIVLPMFWVDLSSVNS